MPNILPDGDVFWPQFFAAAFISLFCLGRRQARCLTYRLPSAIMLPSMYLAAGRQRHFAARALAVAALCFGFFIVLL
jgi:hypothetical protein